MIAESDGSSLFRGSDSTASVGLIERSLIVNGMTCGGCVSHVERALQGVSGVAEARVSLDRGEAKVRYDPAVTGFAAFREAVQAAGYDLKEDSAPDRNAASEALVQPISLSRAIVWPAVVGLIAAALLASLYILIVGVTQDFGHAVELVMGDWYFVIPIALGFGVQVGLFVYVRRVLLRKGARTAQALTGAGTGTSTVSMIACCAHHLTDVLPFLGLSGAAVFLNDNRGPFMALGIAGNIVGIVVMARMIRKIRGQACHV